MPASTHIHGRARACTCSAPACARVAAVFSEQTCRRALGWGPGGRGSLSLLAPSCRPQLRGGLAVVLAGTCAQGLPQHVLAEAGPSSCPRMRTSQPSARRCLLRGLWPRRSAGEAEFPGQARPLGLFVGAGSWPCVFWFWPGVALRGRALMVGVLLSLGRWVSTEAPAHVPPSARSGLASQGCGRLPYGGLVEPLFPAQSLL